MPKKKIDRLKYGEYLDCGMLSCGSHVCVRLGDNSPFGEYEIVKEVIDGDRKNDQVLASGYVTLEAAIERAWKVWGDLTKTEIKLKYKV